jgi:hypothetical protein
VKVAPKVLAWDINAPASGGKDRGLKKVLPLNDILYLS